MAVSWDGVWPLVILLGPLLFLQRRLHFETQAVLLLLTRSREIAIVLFSLLFLPGVALHEGSHFVMARLLGVRTGRLSLFPETKSDGRVRLGYVETARTDVLRDAMIGLAPLLAGGAFVAYAGLDRLDLPSLWAALQGGDGVRILDALFSLPTRPDFWLWFYLVFAVSSTMLPSASDRRAWLPVVAAIGLILIAGLVVGAGPWLVDQIGPLLNEGFRAVAMVVGITVAIHLVAVPPAWALRKMLTRLTGLQVR